MRAVLPMIVLALLVFPQLASGDGVINDPSNFNRIIEVKSTPQLEPGGSGPIEFQFYNPYPNSMMNATLNISIYMFATVEESRPVDDTWEWEEPYFEGGEDHGINLDIGDVPSGTTLNLSVMVHTSTEAPHGTFFSQGTYFVRFGLAFDYEGDACLAERCVMKSRGYFTDEEWEYATRDHEPGDPCFVGEIDFCHLGIDGIVPDTSFGVQDPVPIWPFYLLVFFICLSLFLAFMFYLEENPGTWPWMERKWTRFKGMVKGAIRTSKPELKREKEK